MMSLYQKIIFKIHLLSLQSIAVQGYETGEHAPGLKLKGTGAYMAAHNIIKVYMNLYILISQSRNTIKLQTL